jgi:triosephosphate isomerase
MKFVANFKTNHTRASTAKYIDILNSHLSEIGCDSVLIFPPQTALQQGDGLVEVGAQNGYPAVNGAYTGEVGLEQLREFQIDKILIGHSERREILNESQEFIAKKFNFFKEHNFEIIYCIGEPLEVREKGTNALFDYLYSQFNGIDTSYSRLIVAYEPIWAIGSGVSAKREDIELVHNRLKDKFNIPLLYGGSVKVSNIQEIASIDSVDGVLVGSASLNADSFAELIKKGLGV